MKKIARLLLIPAITVLFATTAMAATSVIENGSFEAGVDNGGFVTLGIGSTSINNWVVVSGTVDYIGTYWVASEGSESLDMTGFSAGAISQTFPTVTSALYRVTFDMSGNPAGGPAEKVLNVDVGGTPEAFTYDISAAANTLTDMKWESKSFDFSATDSTTTITFASGTPGFFGPALDNVSVEQVLPEIAGECKKGGWEDFGVFKNQGDCVSYVATGGRNLPAGQ